MNNIEETTVSELKKEIKKLKMLLGRAKSEIEYLNERFKVNYSDLRWCSSLKYIPSKESDQIVYNVNGKNRIGFFDKENFVARNKYNGRTISFIKVLSWAYINIDLYQNKKTTPKEIQKEMETYRRLRNEKFNAYCGINQDVNPDDFEFDEKKIDIDFTSGPTGYCYSAGEVGIYSDGGVYVGDDEIFNVRDYMNVYVNGQEVEI